MEKTHAPPPKCSDDPVSLRREEDKGKKKLVLLFHYESTFHSNNGQGWLWAKVGKQPIRPKGQGRGIMVSDFINEHDGFLHLTDNEYDESRSSHCELWKEAHYLLKYGNSSEEYWNSDKFMHQGHQCEV